MYALAVYEHYTLNVDMDHVLKIRKMMGELGYEECMHKMDKFQNGLLLCLTDKSWVLDLFGKLIKNMKYLLLFFDVKSQVLY